MKNQWLFKVPSALLIVMLALAALPMRQAYAADTDLQNPTQDAATAAGDGDGFEQNPTNAYANGGGVASNMNGAGDQHIYYGYDLSDIPAGDIVDGIEVQLDWYLDSNANTNSMRVQLSWDGGTSWTAVRSTTTEPTAEATTTLGGPVDDWGHEWFVNELNNTNFRVRITSISTSNTRDFYLDWAAVRVLSHTPPEIDIQGNAISIPDGDGTPVVADGTEFGNAVMNLGIVDHTFTILNTGLGDLNLSNWDFTGGSSSSFILQMPPAATVVPGGSTTFVIRFAPNDNGGNSKSATFTVDTNDSNENPYTFDVHGTRLSAEMDVQGNGISIDNGDGFPNSGDGTEWGNVGQGVAVDRTFTILNTGTADLTIGPITFIGGDAGDFSVVSGPASTVAPGGSTTFTIRLIAGAGGGLLGFIRDTTVNIVNNDANENPYTFGIVGYRVTTVPEIEVLGNGVTIPDGGAGTPSLTNGTNFGNVVVGSNTILTYTIRNNGAANLTIGTFSFLPIGGDFALATAPAATVAAGGSTTFQVRFTPAMAGVRNGSVSFMNNDGTENPYNFNLRGTGIANTAPTITSNGGGATADISGAENTTAVTDVDATDPDAGSTLTYSITGGADQTLFTIVPGTGVLTFTAAPNFEAPADAGANNIYDVTVQASDGLGGTDTQAIAVTVINANENPAITSPNTASVPENTTAVMTVIAADPDAGSTLTYSISGGVDASLFSIAPATGVLTFNPAPDFEVPADAGANNIYDVTVQVSDGLGGTNTQSIAVTVTNANENPAITSPNTASVPENTTAVMTVTAADPDAGSTLTYSITGGTDQTLFSIVPATGVLTFTVAPNFEVPLDAGANNIYDVTVQVADGLGGTDTQAIVVTITNANETPAITSPNTASVPENTTAVMTVTAADPDAGSTLTYSISGGVDAPLFSIAPATGVLTFNPAPDFEVPADAGADNIYDVTVQVSDGALTDTQAIAVTVTNANENPVITSPNTASVPENTTAVMTVTAADPDAGSILTYSISGGVDASLFSIVPGTGVLTFATAPDFEAPLDAGVDNIYDVIVQASDGLGGTNAQSVAVTVTNTNETPVITSPNTANVPENTTVVMTVTAADPDAGSTLTYSIVGGADQTLFSIVPATGVLTFAAAPNFEAPTDAGANNIYDVTVQVSDGLGGTNAQAIAVTVTNVNEAPVVNTATFSIDENSANGSAVGTVTYTDPDAGQTHSFAITAGNASGAFAINAGTGQITVANSAALDFETTPTFSLTVQVTDNGAPNLSGSNTVTVNLNNVNDAPVVTDIPNQTILEGATFTTINLDGYVSDVDNTDAQMTWTYTGNTDLAVNIDVNRVVTIGIPNADWNGAETITFHAADPAALFDEDAATFTVTAVNDAPVVTDIPDQTIVEGATFTTINLDGYVSDVDNTDAQMTWTYTGNTDLTVNIDANRIATIGIPSADWNGSEIITFRAADPGTLFDEDAATFTVTAVNDAPVVNDIPNQTIVEGMTFTTINLDGYVSDADNTDAQMTWTYSGNTDLTVTIDAVRVATIGIPSAAWNGSEAITFTAVDPSLLSDNDAATFTITSVNNAPSFAGGVDQTVNEDAGARTVNGWATGIDDGDAELAQGLTFIVTNNTNPGLFSAGPAIGAAGNLTYTPAANANGTASITIVLTDDGGTANGGVDASTAQTFVINVTAVQDPPSFTSTPVTSATQGLTYTYNITVADPDGDPLTITASTLPAWLTFTPAGAGTATLSGTPTNGDVGSHSVVLRVTDGIVAVPVEQAFTIVVGNVNDAPTFTSAPATSAGESTLYTYNVVTTDPDAGDTLAISATTLPVWLTLVDHGNRTATLSGTPNSSQIGVHNVVLEVTDGTLTALQTFDITVGNTAPQVITNGINTLADTGDGVLTEAERVAVGVTQLLVTFNQDVYDPANDIDVQDVTNPANYLLVRDNGDGFQTTGCDTRASTQDTAITVDGVVYSNGGGTGPFVSTVNINGGLPLSNGNYRLYVCGTTSIVDILDNTLELAGDGVTPGTDFIRNFTVLIRNNGGGGNGDGNTDGNTATTFSRSGLLIPVTGFAPNQTTLLPAQPADKAYTPLNEIRIEIPTLGINFPIVGAAVSSNSWDLTWLKNSVAYLEGSAYPTLSGNTVLTAHVTDANDNLGPFSDIKGMQVGQQIYIHSSGQIFVYQVQQNRRILPSNISAVFKHEEYNWITLVTCEDFNAKTGLYKYRRMVRAVLISVVPEK